MTIGAPRLSLRPITADDAVLLLALDADPEVMRHINGGRPSTASEVDAVIARSIGHRWVAFTRPGGGGAPEFVGWFGLRPAGEGLELGYRLRREHWGKGLATEGARAMVDEAFAKRDAARVWAQTMAVNVRSRRVMERCGLVYVRTFHREWDDPIEGSEHGEVEYELRRDAWARRRAVPGLER